MGTTKLLTAGGGGVNLTPASSIASDVTVNLPSVNGTAVVTSSAVSAAGQIPFSTDGSTFTPTAKIVSGTSVTASGTSVDFTSIPSWVKRITVMFSGISSSGTSSLRVQIGDSGGIETTGYAGSKTVNSSTGASASVYSGGGFDFDNNGAANTTLNYATVVLTNLSGNVWMATGGLGLSTAVFSATNGSKTLTDTLDRVRATFVNGTDTFDAGSINILYE